MSEEVVTRLLKKIPKVDLILSSPEVKELRELYPPEVVREGVRSALQRLRQEIRNGGDGVDEGVLSPERIFAIVKEEVAKQVTPRLRRVINATGVVIHTNLGRSPLSERALANIVEVARGYSNLEYDLALGERGDRSTHVEQILTRLTGAEGGVVVNNNAAAVLLALNTIAAGREVVCSRGELVEIGGAFRVPDVMARSGAILKEVGTTNRTHLRDYEAAIHGDTALLLKVHTSNYRVIGFVAEVSLAELVALGGRYRIPVMNDLGSGSLVDLSAYGLEKEPTVQEAIAAGVDIVTFSGDKLLGGPQAGIILGKRVLIDRIKANPLHRAVRIDKLTLAALEATLISYLSAGTAKEIPTLQMLTMPLARLRRVARRIAHLIEKGTGNASVEVIRGISRVGGGALPTQALSTWVVAIRPLRGTAAALDGALRRQHPPIVARVAEDRLILDPRTIQREDINLLVGGVLRAISEIGAEACKPKGSP